MVGPNPRYNPRIPSVARIYLTVSIAVVDEYELMRNREYNELTEDASVSLISMSSSLSLQLSFDDI